MTRYEIVQDFRDKFLEQNKNVWAPSMTPKYFSINGEEAKTSSYPYSIESSEHAFVAFHYSYIVVSQSDRNMVPLFFNANGNIEDYIEIDGWKLNFDPPITAGVRTYTTWFYISKGAIKGMAIINYSELDNCFGRIWKLFSLARTCSSQKELNYLFKIYSLEEDLLTLKDTNLRQKAEIDAKETLISSYKALLDRIEEIANPRKNEE